MRRLSGCVITVALLAGGVVIAHGQQPKSPEPKPRVVITADPELDDNNTLIRAILYSSDFKIEGLIYVSNQFHWRGDGKGTTQYISLTSRRGTSGETGSGAGRLSFLRPETSCNGPSSG